MGLTKQDIKDFVKVTKDDRQAETTAYATVVEHDKSLGVRIDGSDEITPMCAACTNVKEGQRVVVQVRNHMATVTGNITNPAVGLLELDEAGNLIINSCVTFKGLKDGTTVIDGGWINTKNLNLTGLITFQDLNTAVQEAINEPKKQFSSDLTNWHDTMQPGDKYRKDWDNTKSDWGSPYKFVGEDGKDGQDGRDGDDAYLPTYITDTIIGKGSIQAPEIYANDFSVYPSSSSDKTGSFNLYGNHGSSQYHMFQIYYSAGQIPSVQITSPANAPIYIGSGSGDTFYMNGTFDFSGASVSGIDVTPKYA